MRIPTSVVTLAIVVTLVSGASLHAENGDVGRVFTDAEYGYRVDKHAASFMKHLFYDYGQQARFPLRYAREKPMRFWLSAGGILALVALDIHTYHLLVPSRGQAGNKWTDPAQQLSDWGNNTSAVPLVLGIGAAGIVFDSPRERATSVMLVESLVTSATWTAAFKWVTGRERPRETRERISDWKGPNNVLNDDEFDDRKLRSFPSGHTTGIWAVATVLANQYPTGRVVPVLAYGTAAAMGYSRMVVGAHWFSDVLVGAMIGYGCGKQVVGAHASGHGDYDRSSFGLSFDVLGRQKGVTLTYSF